MFREIGNDKTNISADILLIFGTIWRLFANLYYNANGEIEVWRNTLPHLVAGAFQQVGTLTQIRVK